MQYETERLLLRELRWDDFEDWRTILCDPEIMRHYPAPLDDEGVRVWIKRNLDRYERYGFGLCAVVLKENGRFIGDCGLTMQEINGRMRPEVGYHIRRDCQRMGYAREAAAKWIELGFTKWRFPAIYSYMKYANEASAATARSNGLRLVDEYADPVNTKTRVYRITREEWQTRQRVCAALDERAWLEELRRSGMSAAEIRLEIAGMKRGLSLAGVEHVTPLLDRERF